MGARSGTVLVVLLLVSCTGSRAAVSVRDAGPPGSLATPPVETVEPGGVTITIPASEPRTMPSTTARLAFVGDVMLGRGVAPVVAADPSSVFERLRPALVGADLALGNLESPLTERPHLVGEYALEADPSAAGLLAGAGFDVLGLANNHATDTGRETVLESITALGGAGLTSVGGGASAEEAAAPVIVEVEGLRIGILAFDLAGGIPAGVDAPGVSTWHRELAEVAVRELSDAVDVVVVGVHGGVEYLARADPVLIEVTRLLAGWGADVVWGHGAHVVYPVEASGGSVVAPGLGNALFDQPWPRTAVGSLLEVLVGGDGAIAWRTGRISIDAGRSGFEGWDEPGTEAVAFDGDWWTPVRELELQPPRDLAVDLPPAHQVVARAAGDVTGAGQVEVVVSYRRPAIPERVHSAFPEVAWIDADGRTAHLAVRTSSGRLRWGSAFMFQPVGSLAVCDGSIALGFTTLDDASIASGGAWFWDGFGFRTAPVLPGRSTPGCVDVDGDGTTEPVLTARIAAQPAPEPSGTSDD